MEARVRRLPTNTIRGEVSALRFGHIVSWLGDFAKGGIGYKEAPKSIMRGANVGREIPFSMDLINWGAQRALASDESRKLKDEPMCATTVGFFFLLRVEGTESLRMKEVTIDKEDGDETVVSIYIRSGKSDQYNNGSFETLKRVTGAICPVNMCW